MVVQAEARCGSSGRARADSRTENLAAARAAVGRADDDNTVLMAAGKQ